MSVKITRRGDWSTEEKAKFKDRVKNIKMGERSSNEKIKIIIGEKN